MDTPASEAGLLRASIRRFTRLSLGFSKKKAPLVRSVPVVRYYNLGRIHRSIRVTPAMESGLTDHVWELAELLT